MRQRYRFLKLSPSSRWHRRRICPTFFCYKPVVLVALVPGAGLEPARTLPGPRDFKSTNYCNHQQLPSTKTLYQRRFSVGVASFCFLVVVSLVTATVTVQRQPASAPHRIARVWTDTFERRWSGKG